LLCFYFFPVFHFGERQKVEVPPRDDNGTTRRMGRVVHELFAAGEAARVSGVEHGALLNMGRHLTDMM
jgi:hypothetical protein